MCSTGENVRFTVQNAIALGNALPRRGEKPILPLNAASSCLIAFCEIKYRFLLQFSLTPLLQPD
jgi:hypothetical protein